MLLLWVEIFSKLDSAIAQPSNIPVESQFEIAWASPGKRSFRELWEVGRAIQSILFGS